MTTKHDVIRLADGTKSARQIADRLGCMPEYVHKTAKRNGLLLARGTFERRAPTPTQLKAKIARLEEERDGLLGEKANLLKILSFACNGTALQKDWAREKFTKILAKRNAATAKAEERKG